MRATNLALRTLWGMDFCFQQGIGEEATIEVEYGIQSREECSERDREEGKVLNGQWGKIERYMKR